MNKLFFFIFLLIIFTGCEDDTEGGVYTRNEPGEKYINRSKGTKIDAGELESGKILDNYTVTSIAFDKLGNTWIGTFSDGLIKYNTREAIIFNASNSFFSNKSINSIAVDHTGNVWIGNEVLTKYDGEKFIKFDKESAPIQVDYNHSINIDSDNNIWFSSSQHGNGGVIKYDGKKTWRVITPNNSILPGNLISDIAIGINNEVWVSITGVQDNQLIKIVDDQIVKYTNNDLGFTPYNIGVMQVNSKNQLCATIDYTLSSATHPDGPHAFIFDGKTSKQLKMEGDNVYLRSLFVDKEDKIWYAASGKILIFDGNNWISKALSDNTTALTITQAPDGKMWIGTEKGIHIIDSE